MHADDNAVVNHFGAYAENVTVPNSKLIPLPPDISDDFAMLLFQGITAEYLTSAVHPLHRDETVLVYAAAGGVGSTLMQVVKAAGARPIGIVSAPAKAQTLRDRGYEVLVRNGTDLSLIRSLIPEGVDVVFDGNGKESWELTLASVKRRGHVVIFGAAGNEHDPIALSLLRDRGSLTLTFPSISDYTADSTELQTRAAHVFDWLRDEPVLPQPFHTFPLRQANEALAFLQSRKSTGKIVLVP